MFRRWIVARIKRRVSGWRRKRSGDWNLARGSSCSPASFKLSASGEAIYLIDTDANLNAVLDSVVFGAQATDVSFGRSAVDADVWTTMTPTPGVVNQ